VDGARNCPSEIKEDPVRKLLIACVVACVAVAPAAAGAADAGPADVKNAAKYCKELRKASGPSFASMFGPKRNAYGKCVSQTAKQRAAEDERQAKAAKSNAARDCRAEREDPGFAAAHGGKTFAEFYGTGKNGRNAYGKCVSAKAKAQRDEADAEDEAQEDDRINAAQRCKQARKDDPEQFGEDYGTKRNAFGKCVSRTAKELAAERRQDA
jgi:hypothetical protein